MSFFHRLTLAANKFRELFTPSLRVVEIVGDELPSKISRNRLVHLIDDDESWSVGFHCPCGCGDVLELMLLSEVKPRWSLTIDSRNRPTLDPSVWRDIGCKSHFWIRKGKVVWC